MRQTALKDLLNWCVLKILMRHNAPTSVTASMKRVRRVRTNVIERLGEAFEGALAHLLAGDAAIWSESVADRRPLVNLSLLGPARLRVGSSNVC
jgi:hypothetical protein